MTVTITGSKYSGTISSVGTATRLVNSSASFSSGDFVKSRLVALYNSAGTAFRGFSYSRRRVSSTELELIYPFIDRDGSTVTQVVGDSYQVSKDFSDSVTAGITVTGGLVTISDHLVFGSAGDIDSVCFYEENKTIVASKAGGFSEDPIFSVAGGLAAFGRIDNYQDRSFSRSCNFLYVTTDAMRSVSACSSTSGGFIWAGGSIYTERTPTYIGSWTSSNLGSPGLLQWYWNIQTNCDFARPAPWGSNEQYQQVVNATAIVDGANAIACRWGDGRLEGGTFSALGGDPLSVFGSDSGGTFLIESPPGTFITVFDCGTIGNFRPGLWRSSGEVHQTINYTNIISPKRSHIAGGGNVVNNNATGNFYYSGSYTSLQTGTLCLVKNNNLRSDLEYSAVSSDSAVLKVLEATVVGITETIRENSWVAGFYFYGYQISINTFATGISPASGGQTSKIVKFGGAVPQVIDINISQVTASTVAAYTQLETADKLYDYAQYHKALNTTNALIPTYNTQLFSIVAGALTTPWNITIDSGAGSVFAADTNTSTVTVKASALASGTKSSRFTLAANRTITFAQTGDKSAIGYDIPATGIVVVASGGATDLRGSTFASGATINRTSGSATVLVDQSQLANITAGTGVTLRSRISITASWTGISQAYVSIQVAGAEVVNSGLTTSPYVYDYDYTGSPTVTVKILRQGYSRFSTSFAASANTQTISAVLVANSTAYTGSTNSELSITVDAADTAHKIRIGNAQIPVQTIYDAIEDAAIANPLRNNLQVTPTLTINGAYLTLNTSTQLIRDLAGDANAAVLGAVFRSDGSNPIDGTNGGVTLLGPQGLTQQNVRDALALALTVGTTVNAGSVDAQNAAIKAKTDSLNFSVTGRVDSTVYGMEPNTLTGAALADSAVSEIAAAGFTGSDRLLITALLSELHSRFTPTRASNLDNLTGPGIRGFLGLSSANIDTQFMNIPTNVWANGTRVLTAGTNIALAKGTGITGFNDISATDVWVAATRSLTDKSGFSLSGTQSFNLTGNITGNLSGSVGSVTSAIALPNIPNNWITAAGINAGAITAAKFATDAIDGSAISASAVTEIQSGLATSSAVGAIPTNPLLTNDSRLNNLDATISSRLATSGYTTPPTVANIWAAATTGLTGIGTIGKLLADNIDAAISSRSTYAGADTAGTTTLLSRLTSTRAGSLDNLDATISSRLATSGYTAPSNASIATILTNTNRVNALIEDSGGDRFTAKALETAPSGGSLTAADIWGYSDRQLTAFGFTVAPTVTQIWSAATSTFTGVGTVGKLLADNLNAPVGSIPTSPADSSGVTTLLTRLSATRAGHLDNLSGGAPLLAANYTPPDNSAIAAIKTQTDKLTFTGTDLRVTLDGEKVVVSTNEDKSNYLLATGGNDAIALAVQTILADEFAANGFTTSDRTALLSAQAAALAVADGEQQVNFLASTFTQRNVGGAVRTVFDLKDQDGNAATSPQTAVWRIPR